MSKNLIILIIVFLSIVGIISILFVTKYGVGTTPDSVVYIGAARNMMIGKGISIPFGQVNDSPMTHHAPLYSVLLRIIGISKIDPLIGARWLNAFIFGSLILIVGLGLYKLNQPPKITSILGSFLVLCSYPLLLIHSYAWTESLFILLGLIGLTALTIHIKEPTNSSLIVSAFLIGLATLTRYAGIAIIGTGILSILIFPKKKASKRIFDAAIFSLISFLPFVFWIMRNSSLTGTATSRNFAYHPVNKFHLTQLINTLSGWFLLPQGVSMIIKLLVFSILFGFLVVIITSIIKNKKETENFPVFILVLCLFIVIYPTFLLVSISFLDANTPLDDRILSPLFIPLTIVLFYFLNKFYILNREKPIIKNVLIIIAIIISTLYFYNGISWIINNNEDGLGFSSRGWQESVFINQIQKLPSGSTLFSNAPHAVYILTENSVQALPKESIDTTQKINQSYLSEMNDVRSQIQNGNAYVLYFSLIGQGSKQNEDEIINLLSLTLHSKFSEGSIFQTNPDN